MDVAVELQIQKHLKWFLRGARSAIAYTDSFASRDRSCKAYHDLFPEVRSYEGFKYLHQAMPKQGFLVVFDDELRVPKRIKNDALRHRHCFAIALPLGGGCGSLVKVVGVSSHQSCSRFAFLIFKFSSTVIFRYRSGCFCDFSNNYM